MEEALSLALHSFASSRSAKQSKANAAGVNDGIATPTQAHLLRTLQKIDGGWNTVRYPMGLRALNRRFGITATTEGLQRMVEEVREGLEARNPFALLWTVVEDLSGEET